MISISDKKKFWIQITCFLLVIGVTVFIAMLACVPPVSRDALTHHLAVPKLYLQHGGIYEIPRLRFSYYPMNLDLLYLIPLYFNNDILPKFIHFAFAVATSVMIYRYLLRRINREYALLGTLFFLTIPIIVRLSSTVYVDLGLICFLFASLLYLFHWVESGFRVKYLVISSVFCGLALGTKYNGLVGLFLLGLFVAFVYARYHAGLKWYGVKSGAWCAAFFAIALTVFSPWMVRNIIWTGNPVYPLYNGIFHTEKTFAVSDAVAMSKQHSGMSHIQARRRIYNESWPEIALIPVRVFFQGKDDNPKYFDGRTNPFLLILPFFAFLGIWSGNPQKRTEKMMLLFFSVLFLLYACAATSIRIRYFSPILPPLVVLSMFGLYNIQTVILENSPRISAFLKKVVIFGIIFVMIGLNIQYMVNRFQKDRPLAYISGRLPRAEYIQAYRPEYASLQYANTNLEKDSKILGVYVGHRGYYSDIDIEFSLVILRNLAAEAISGHDIARKLHERGYTHLLVNYPLFKHWAQKYSLHEKQMLKEFFKTCTIKEFSKDGYGLLQVMK